MLKMNRMGWRTLAGALALASLAGCAHRQSPMFEESPNRADSRQTMSLRGTVQDIDALSSRESTTGAGALIGGVVGAVVGRQFGSSPGGRTTGTVLGAVGGAVLGNEVERQREDTPARYRVSVRLESGAERVFNLADLGGLRVGDRVLVTGNRLQRE